MLPYNFINKGQPKTRTVAFCRKIRFKYFFKVFLANPRARVAYAYPYLAVPSQRGNGQQPPLGMAACAFFIR